MGARTPWGDAESCREGKRPDDDLIGASMFPFLAESMVSEIIRNSARFTVIIYGKPRRYNCWRRLGREAVKKRRRRGVGGACGQPPGSFAASPLERGRLPGRGAVCGTAGAVGGWGLRWGAVAPLLGSSLSPFLAKSMERFALNHSARFTITFYGEPCCFFFFRVLDVLRRGVGVLCSGRCMGWCGGWLGAAVGRYGRHPAAQEMICPRA